MTIAGELINILGFKLEGTDNLRKWNQGMNMAETNAKNSAERIRRLGIAAGLVTTGLITLGVSAYKNFAGFEREMTRIGITAGATVKATQSASDTVQKMAYDLALPIDQAVAGLDTLVASGMNLESAMAFLPSVLATAQASGAATTDIANTAIKAASALKIEAGQMQMAFDIMVAGGKAGQFELRDMAAYIPSLANTFANMGYTGESGLKKLIALLQTLREDTGSASEAATNAENVFGKMFSQETERNFKKFHVNIRKEVDEQVKAGHDLVDSYVAIANRVMKENPTAKLTDLFADQQFRAGMQSLMTSGDSMKHFLDVLNSADVKGGTMHDLGVILDNQQTKIDRLATSWDNFMKTLGAGLSGPIGGALDSIANSITKQEALTLQLKKEGYDSFGSRLAWSTLNPGSVNEKARAGGYAPTAADREVQKNAPDAYRVLGRYPQRPQSTVTRDGTARKETMFDPGAESKALYEQIANMNSNLAAMTSGSGIGATITDSRTTSVSVSAPVTVNVTQPTDAPMAVGNAVSGAIGKAATGAAQRLETEPAQP